MHAAGPTGQRRHLARLRDHPPPARRGDPLLAAAASLSRSLSLPGGPSTRPPSACSARRSPSSRCRAFLSLPPSPLVGTGTRSPLPAPPAGSGGGDAAATPFPSPPRPPSLGHCSPRPPAPGCSAGPHTFSPPPAPYSPGPCCHRPGASRWRAPSSTRPEGGAAAPGKRGLRARRRGGGGGGCRARDAAQASGVCVWGG